MVVAKPSVQHAWAAEIVRRVEEIQTGAVVPIRGDVFTKHFRAKVARLRRRG